MAGQEHHLKRTMGVWTGISIVIEPLSDREFFKQGQVLENGW